MSPSFVLGAASGLLYGEPASHAISMDGEPTQGAVLSPEPLDAVTGKVKSASSQPQLHGPDGSRVRGCRVTGERLTEHTSQWSLENKPEGNIRDPECGARAFVPGLVRGCLLWRGETGS